MIFGQEFIRAFNEIGDDPATGAICACCWRNEPIQDMVFVYGGWICASCYTKNNTAIRGRRRSANRIA